MRKKHPMDTARAGALETIGKIADRAIGVYAKHNVRLDRETVLLDLMACHFHACALRLHDLLEASEFGLIHDISGINKNLNRETYTLEDFFTPRFAARQAVPA